MDSSVGLPPGEGLTDYDSDSRLNCRSTSIRFVLIDNDATLYILVEKDDTSGKSTYDLTVTDGDSFWTGAVDATDLEMWAKQSTYNVKDYIDMFEKAFGVVRSPDSYIYKLVGQKEQCGLLSWSICIDGEKLMVKLGNIRLTKSPVEGKNVNITAMLKSLVIMQNNTEDDSMILQKKVEELQSVAQQAVKQLEDFVLVQKQSEQILYQNFVSVLNEKKRKLRELRDECESLRETLNSTNPEEDNPKPQKAIKRQSAKAPKITVTRKQIRNKARLRSSPKELLYEDSSEDQNVDLTKEQKHMTSSTKEEKAKSKNATMDDAHTFTQPAEPRPSLMDDLLETSVGAAVESKKRSAAAGFESKKRNALHADRRNTEGNMEIDELLDGL